MKLTTERFKKIMVPGDSDGGFIEIRNLTLEEIAQIESKYMNVTSSDVHMTNFAQRDADYVHACLKGWGELYDPSGRPLKFNTKNIMMASALNIQVSKEDGSGDTDRLRFFAWINMEREKFAEEVEAEEKVALGN